MVFPLEGKIHFELENVTKKHAAQAAWKRVAAVVFPCDVHLYYSWLLKRRFNLNLNRPLRGAHVTFISDKMRSEDFERAKKIFEGKLVTVYVEIEPRSNGEHWWLRVHAPELESIREVAGLRREPYFSFHLTLGLATHRELEHSEYILRQCQRFELISNEPRQPLETHEVWKLK